MNITELKEKYDLAFSYYAPEHRKLRLLDATDRGELWKALAAKFPPYQILPDTNFISYIKNNLVASIYTVGKSAQIQPTSEKDQEIVEHLNIALEQIWNLSRVGYYQFLAGERAALTNLGLTQVGWDDTLSGGSGDSFYRGNITLKNVDPLKFMRDPFAPSLETAGWCVYYDNYHKSVFLENPKYKEAFKKFYEKKKGATPDNIPMHSHEKPAASAKDYFTLYIYWVNEDGIIKEYHVINNEEMLWERGKILPNEYPFAELYCNLPAGAVIGSSECLKAFANNVAYNLMDSIELTAEYKNQRPPKFISSQSGLNIAAFNKYGNEADHTFIVQGPADKAVHYHQFPTPSANLPSLKIGLQQGIQLISGIDQRYTGRDTGSIITTGGIEDMLNRVTVIDMPKIMTYEAYTLRLTKLILANFLEFSPNRKYFYKDMKTNKWKTQEVKFRDIDSKTLFNYAINISSELPKNKARIAQMANMMMEKQMQYGPGNGPQLLTQEEWLMFQDLPNREYMLERMGIERMQNTVEEVSQILFQYANLVKQGMNPDDAILATANSMEQRRRGELPEEPPIPPVVDENVLPPTDDLKIV